MVSITLQKNTDNAMQERNITYSLPLPVSRD